MFNKTIILLLIAVLAFFAPAVTAGPVAGAACFTALAAACAGLGAGWYPCYMAGLPACEAAVIAPTP